jgi:hypothetical protein
MHCHRNRPDARKAVSALIDDLGFAPMDLGSLQNGAPQQCFHPLWAKNLILSDYGDSAFNSPLSDHPSALAWARACAVATDAR